MNNTWSFLIKLLLLSAGISAAIKYLAPFVPIVPTQGVVLAMVLLPPVLMAALLGWRATRSPVTQSTRNIQPPDGV